MEFAITFLEGIVTFVSPCLLPMLPIYVAYFAGGAQRVDAPGRLRRTIVNALGFVAGFTLLFTLLGAFAGGAGSFFQENRALLDAVCGGVVVLLGLNYLGVLRIPALQRTLKPQVDVLPRNLAASFVFGLVFAVGWTPCVGAFLGAALGMAAVAGSAGRGIALLLCYSAGLGVPFVLAAVLVDQLEGAFSWVKAHYRIIDAICGALLVVVGVLMATGTFGTWLGLLAVP